MLDFILDIIFLKFHITSFVLSLVFFRNSMTHFFPKNTVGYKNVTTNPLLIHAYICGCVSVYMYVYIKLWGSSLPLEDDNMHGFLKYELAFQFGPISP